MPQQCCLISLRDRTSLPSRSLAIRVATIRSLTCSRKCSLNEHNVSGPEPALPMTRLTFVALPTERTTGPDAQKAKERGPRGVGRRTGAAFVEDAYTVVSRPTFPYP